MSKICSNINTNRNNMRCLVLPRPNLKPDKTFARYLTWSHFFFSIYFVFMGLKRHFSKVRDDR